MDENTNIKDLLSKLTIKQVWGVISGIIVLIGTITGTSYTLGSSSDTDCSEKVMMSRREIHRLELEQTDLKNQVLMLSNEVTQYKVTLEMMRQKDQDIEPIIKMLLEEYKKKIIDK